MPSRSRASPCCPACCAVTAIAVNIEIMRTFVKLRGMLGEHSDLKRKLNTLEKKYDENFRMVFDAIHELMDEPVPGAYGRRRIGFTKEK